MVCVCRQWQRQSDGALMDSINCLMGFICHDGGLMVASRMTWVV